MSQEQRGPSFKNKNFKESLKHASSGLRQLVREERNVKFHLLAALLVIGIGLVLPLSRTDYAWLGLAIFLVLISEINNTIFENIIDLVQPSYHPLAKKIKDMAAGAVLLTSIFAVFIGIIILLPAIISWLL